LLVKINQNANKNDFNILGNSSTLKIAKSNAKKFSKGGGKGEKEKRKREWH
jgi:hypothetical protein